MHTVCIRQKRSKGIFTHDLYCLQPPYLIFKKITNYEKKFLAKIIWAQKQKNSGNFGAASRKLKRNLRETFMHPWCNLRVIWILG